MDSDFESAMVVLGGLVCVAGIFGLVYLVLTIIGTWKTFTKAGVPGWVSIIPFYSTYTQVKLCGPDSMFYAWLACWIVDFILSAMRSASGGGIFINFLSLVAAIALVIVNILVLYKWAKVFGKGIGFTVGLVLLQPVFSMILGFDSSQYDSSNVDMNSWIR